MRSKLKIPLVTLFIALQLNTLPVFAVGTLDEAINSSSTENTQTQDSNSSSSQSQTIPKAKVSEKDRAFIDGLAESSNISADLAGGNQATEAIRSVATTITKVIFNALPYLLVARVGIDLVFIVVTPLRGVLANGHTGQAKQPEQGQQQQGGFGGGGFGGGSYGNQGFGGGGYGNQGFGGGGMGAMNGQQQPQGMKMQIVSNAALNAVETEKTVSTWAMLKIYAKDMIILFIAIPVLVLLAATGVLTSIGVAIGAFLVDICRTIANLIV